MSGILGRIEAVFWNVIHKPNLIDLIDILLFAFILYQLLIHVQQTRVSQTLKGIVILLGATLLSGALGMRTIHALLSWMINAGPVLLIILFQSEIRRVLEEIGNSALFDEFGRQDRSEGTDTLIEEMILAMVHMARRRVGALIVIEQGIRLNDVIATGTKVDGVVTQPLLENIFEPNTPLHDGAVIVRDDRVVAAACLLRLSDSTGVGRDLGTRHRAALGMSEISDAVIFVVSEETGIISMAERGKLTRSLDDAALRKKLHGIYDGKKETGGMAAIFGRRRKSGYDGQQADKEA